MKLRARCGRAGHVALLGALLTLAACMASLGAAGSTADGHWAAGNNYVVLSHPQTVTEAPGTVHVIEFFWYGCPHCDRLEPFLEVWRSHKAPYIDFERIPVYWGEPQQAHARLFYTLKVLGQLERLHSAVFDAIHRDGDPLYVPGNAAATVADQQRFATRHGIDAAAFDRAYHSLAVRADLRVADEMTSRYMIDGVPTLIVDGKYATNVGRAGGDGQLIQLINDLAAREHRTAEVSAGGRTRADSR